MKIQIDRGIKTYQIEDADGRPLGEIRINPSDPGLVPRWGELVSFLDEHYRTDITLEETLALDAELKAKFVDVFAAPVSEVLFGGLSCFALCETGKLVAQNVVEALQPLLETALKDAADAAQKRMAKHTDAYAGTDAGLAPGQQV